MSAVPVLEPLRWWDIEELVRLEELIFPTDSPWSAATFWSEMAAGHHYVVHRDARGAIDGYAGLADNDDAEVQNIAVRPDARGSGLGRALLADLLGHATAERILLEVRTDNDPAIGLYTSVGFTVLGVRRGYYQPSGADAYVMQKIVDPGTAGHEDRPQSAGQEHVATPSTVATRSPQESP